MERLGGSGQLKTKSKVETADPARFTLRILTGFGLAVKPMFDR
jgi:hypothetical protein